jgi:hypothetical protein
MNYRKLGTALTLLARYRFEVKQSVRLQTGSNFVELKSEGDVRGFQSFSSALNGLLNQPETQAEATLTLNFTFDPPIATQGARSGAPIAPEIESLQQILNRNPVDRLQLSVNVEYGS